MMTIENIIEVLQAFKEGKKLEYKSVVDGEWQPSVATGNELMINMSSGKEYRVKSTPKLRPWKPEEVPVGALYQHKECNTGGRGLICYCSQYEIGTIGQSGNVAFSINDFFKKFNHSTDGGKTWKPCGV